MTMHPAAHSGPSPRRAVLAATAVLTLGFGLAACGGGEEDASGPQRATSATSVAWNAPSPDRMAVGVAMQADAQQRAVGVAAQDAAAEDARQAAERARDGSRASADGQCTTRPEDRANCTLPPGAEIRSDGGDVDGDGVFEPDEPVGPGYRDPRAYDGGPSSGELQCEYLREQGQAC